MSHVSSKPFFVLTGVPNSRGFVYGANQVGDPIACSESYTFIEYDTEDEVAEAVDSLMGIPGWYWECSHRIPYPPNPNSWSKADCFENQ